MDTAVKSGKGRSSARAVNGDQFEEDGGVDGHGCVPLWPCAGHGVCVC
jgi:hypothetical protein